MPALSMPSLPTAQAEVLLPSVTTITLNTLELSAPGMVEWSDKMEMPPRPGDLEPEEPVTLVVVNPGGDDSSELTVQTAVRSDLAILERAKISERSGRTEGAVPSSVTDHTADVDMIPAEGSSEADGRAERTSDSPYAPSADASEPLPPRQARTMMSSQVNRGPSAPPPN
jgi:hypothetical protein